jgi:hypothetical protein
MDDILPDPTTEETVDGLKRDDLAVPVGNASGGSAARDRFVAQPVTQPGDGRVSQVL